LYRNQHINTMLITFVPTGETVQVGLGACTPQALAGYTSNPIYLTTPSGYTPVQGTMAAGSSANFPMIGQYNQPAIGFYSANVHAYLVTKFTMDDAAAVTTGMATISTALDADDATLLINSDGTAGS
jgi:hypothetical protein